MLRFDRKVYREECGATLVEFALACMLFLTMLFGICGFGHALYAYHFVSHAAKSAARWAAVNGSSCAGDASCTSPASADNIKDYVVGIVPPGINGNSSACTTVTDGSGNQQSEAVPTSDMPLAVCSSWASTNTSTNTVCNGSWSSSFALAGTPPVPVAAQNNPGCTVQVRVSYKLESIVPLVPSSITMSSSSEMVIAH